MSEIAAIVLAAGKGTRMKSALPKVLHRIAGRSMVGHVLDNLAALKVAKTAVVIAPGMESVAKEVAPHPSAIQQEQLGTAHAAAAARDVIGKIDGTVLVLFGDSPFISAGTIDRMVKRREAADRPTVVVLGMRPEDPGAYGRLITDEKGNLSAIVEHRDADEKQRAIGLCNSGVMAIDGRAFWDLIDAIENKNAKQEYYLTDIVGVARSRGLNAVVVEAPADELIGINSFVDSDAQGLNYAVSVDEVTRVMKMNGDRLADGSVIEAKASESNAGDATVQPASATGDSGDGDYQTWNYDDDNDGKPERWGVDVSGDGKPDLFLLDQDGDGEVDYGLLDRNQDEKPEARIIYGDETVGECDVWEIDENEDGKPDSIGMDYDYDGKPDVIRPA